MMKGVLAVFGAVAALTLLAVQGQETSREPALDRMIAEGKSSQELALYVFDTHGCKSCHTIGENGKLGYTEKGRERAKGFEGCINMLTAMTIIVQTPEDKRSAQQRDKAQRFEEFGCTACHKLSPGKLGLTEAGAKLAHLHLGCVEVEQLTSGQASVKHCPSVYRRSPSKASSASAKELCHVR